MTFRKKFIRICRGCVTIVERKPISCIRWIIHICSVVISDDAEIPHENRTDKISKNEWNVILSKLCSSSCFPHQWLSFLVNVVTLHMFIFPWKFPNKVTTNVWYESYFFTGFRCKLILMLFPLKVLILIKKKCFQIRSFQNFYFGFETCLTSWYVLKWTYNFLPSHYLYIELENN